MDDPVKLELKRGKMAVNISKRDLAWSYIGYGISIGINIIILPLLLKFLTSKELGLWYSFVSIGYIAILLDFGFAPTIARNITYCWGGAKSLQKIGVAEDSNYGKPNFELLVKVINTCKVIYFIISIVALFFLLTGGTIYIKYISREIEGSLHIYAWLIYCLAIFINLFYGFYTSLLRGVGAISQGNKAIIISRLFQILISLVGLTQGFGIIALALSYLLSGFILRWISKWYFYEYENIANELKKYSKRIKIDDVAVTFRAIWHNAWRDGIVSLAKFLILQSNTILCSIYIGLEATASYALSLQLIAVIGSVASIVYATYQPLLAETFLLNDISRTKRIFSVSMVAFYLTYWIGVIGLVFVGLPLLNLIKSDTVIKLTVLLFMAVYLFLESNHSLFASFISMGNKIPYVKAFIISGLATVLFSFILLKTTNLGIWALMISSCLVQLIYNNWKWPSVVLNDLRTNLWDMITLGFSEVKRQMSSFNNGDIDKV